MNGGDSAKQDSAQGKKGGVATPEVEPVTVGHEQMRYVVDPYSDITATVGGTGSVV